MRVAVISGLALVAVVGCRGPAAAVAPSPLDAPSKAPVKPPHVRAGFVLYTVDDDGARSTWVVPYTPGDTRETEPALELAGWWVQEDEPARVTAWNRGETDGSSPLSEATASRLWDARCPVGSTTKGACTWPPGQVVTSFAADGAVREQLVDGEACACFKLPVADRAVLLAGKYQALDQGIAPGEDDEESCDLAYHFVDSTVAALLGGVMQSFKLYNDLTCDGTRATDVSVEQEPLAGTTALPSAAVSNRFCSVSDDPQVLDWTLPPGFEEPVDDEPTAKDEEDGETDCDIDGEFWSVRRGHLVRTEVGAHVWQTCACHASTPVSPKQCGSAADPCGSAAAFPGLLESSAEFWVDADERAALVLGDKPAILFAGGRLRAPLDPRFLPRSDHSERIVGVRHHRSIDPLARASAAEVEDPALSWLPVALRWPTATVTAPPVPALAPADRDRVDPRGGRDWGNRCFAHFKAGRLDAAEAACTRGLDVATDEAIRGAIHHSLGRIAEARGDDEAAVVHYRTSLALREDDATEKRFFRLLEQSR